MPYPEKPLFKLDDILRGLVALPVYVIGMIFYLGGRIFNRDSN